MHSLCSLSSLCWKLVLSILVLLLGSNSPNTNNNSCHSSNTNNNSCHSSNTNFQIMPSSTSLLNVTTTPVSVIQNARPSTLAYRHSSFSDKPTCSTAQILSPQQPPLTAAIHSKVSISSASSNQRMVNANVQNCRSKNLMNVAQPSRQVSNQGDLRSCPVANEDAIFLAQDCTRYFLKLVKNSFL